MESRLSPARILLWTIIIKLEAFEARCVGSVTIGYSGAIEKILYFMSVPRCTFVVLLIGVTQRPMLLLHKNPPNTKPLPGELLLWWGVIRRAAFDVLHGHEQSALDAYEFLSQTGIWMLIDHFELSEDRAIQEIAGLVRRYNVRAKRKLPIR